MWCVCHTRNAGRLNLTKESPPIINGRKSCDFCLSVQLTWTWINLGRFPDLRVHPSCTTWRILLCWSSRCNSISMKTWEFWSCIYFTWQLVVFHWRASLGVSLLGCAWCSDQDVSHGKVYSGQSLCSEHAKEAPEILAPLNSDYWVETLSRKSQRK